MLSYEESLDARFRCKTGLISELHQHRVGVIQLQNVRPANRLSADDRRAIVVLCPMSSRVGGSTFNLKYAREVVESGSADLHQRLAGCARFGVPRISASERRI